MRTEAKFPKYLREAFEKFPNIKSSRGIMSGTPCVVSRRIPVYTLAGRYAAGETMEFIAEDYELTLAEVESAVRFSCWISKLSSIEFWKFYGAEMQGGGE